MGEMEQVEEGCNGTENNEKSKLLSSRVSSDPADTASSSSLTSLLTSSLASSSMSSSAWNKPLATPTDSEYLSLKSPMLRRYPSFVPLRRHATSIAEVAFLVPSAGSSRRQATVTSATFNMTATIIGGGVLSIPLSCARAGLIPFTILMIMSALMTDFSLYILCSCARRTGSTSYGLVARKAFGSGLELFSTAVIFFLVGFVVVGLMVLNQGIWSPIVFAFLARTDDGNESKSASQPVTTSSLQDAVVLIVMLVLMFPYLLKKDLTSLRHICYVGFVSIAVLCVAMVYRALEQDLWIDQGAFENVKWIGDNISDVLVALPIILLAFLCSFNIISVHCSLVEPTRERVREVIHKSVLLSFLVMYIFGVAGYLWAFDTTNGNILLNFDPSDKVIFVGRIGCGITTLFALPMNVLPCREALLSLIAQIGEIGAKRGASKSELRHLLAQRAEGEGNTFHKEKKSNGASRILSKAHTVELGDEKKLSNPDNDKDTVGDLLAPPTTPRKTTTPRKKTLQQKGLDRSNQAEAIHWVATFAIVATCYIAAVLAPGVAIVWDIAGSSMAFLIQFIIPSVCYISLKRSTSQKGVTTKKTMQAWALFVFSSIGAILCTSIVVSRLLVGEEQ